MTLDLFSGIFAYLAFIIVCINGALRGMPLNDTLTRALLALIVFAIIGRVLGELGRRLVLESITQEKAEEPIPDLDETVMMDLRDYGVRGRSPAAGGGAGLPPLGGPGAGS